MLKLDFNGLVGKGQLEYLVVMISLELVNWTIMIPLI